MVSYPANYIVCKNISYIVKLVKILALLLDISPVILLAKMFAISFAILSVIALAKI